MSYTPFRTPRCVVRCAICRCLPSRHRGYVLYLKLIIDWCRGNGTYRPSIPRNPLRMISARASCIWISCVMEILESIRPVSVSSPSLSSPRPTPMFMLVLVILRWRIAALSDIYHVSASVLPEISKETEWLIIVSGFSNCYPSYPIKFRHNGQSIFE